MDVYENKFLLKPIQKSTDEDYALALRIYSEATPSEIRTNTNELTHWLEKKNTQGSFELLMFILYLDDVAIGFSQLTYLYRQKAVMLDYISLKEPYRVNAVFLVFLSMLQNHLSASGREISYYIAEISNKDGGENIDKESNFYKRVICLENFGKVESKYYNLPLGLDNYESEFEAIMYIKTNDIITYINKDTFFSIVTSICYDYYLVWYSEFLNTEEIEQYKQKLDNCVNEIKKSLSGTTRISVVYPDCPLFAQKSNEKTSGAIPAVKKGNVPKFSLIIILVLICPIILAALYSKVLPLLNIQFSAVSTFIGSLLGTLVTILLTYIISKKK